MNWEVIRVSSHTASMNINRNTIVHELGLFWHMLCYFRTGCLKQSIYIAAQSRIWNIWRTSWRKNGTVVLLQRRRFLRHRIRSGGEAAWANKHYHHRSVVVLALFFSCTSSYPSVKCHWEHRDNYVSVTESQKGWGWEGPPKIIWPNPLLNLDPVAQDHVQMAVEYLQGGRLHNLPGQLVWCSVTLTGKWVSPGVQEIQFLQL